MRVAIYFTPPPEHPLTRSAAAWLGRDAFSGEELDRPPVPGFDAKELADLTNSPRRYGFHATLMSPFRFADGYGVEDVRTALADFVGARAAVKTPPLRLQQIGAFNALTLAPPTTPVDDLAAEIVRTFDIFRAALLPEEIARRRPDHLGEAQRRNLDRWGYPYVFDQFLYHMTLTGPVPAPRQAAVRAALAARFAPFIGEPLVINALSLFVEDESPGPFRVLSSLSFAETAGITDDA